MQRVRASTPREKTGCATCRKRRVKCDEGKPTCQRCRRSGWACPGYSEAIVKLHNPIIKYSLLFRVPGSQEERRALHYFSTFASADLDGYLSSNFWSRTVLQRCQQSVPIRHAATALGRAHMEYLSSDDSVAFSVSAETTEAYTKAIKALRNYLEKREHPDRSIVLTCSAIFFVYELVCGERDTALSHLGNGLKILKTWHSTETCALRDSPNADVRDELVAAYAQMDFDASIFNDGRPMAVNVDLPVDEEIDDANVEPFGTLQAAQRSLFPLLRGCLQFLIGHAHLKIESPGCISEEVLRQRRKLLDQLRVWERRADASKFEYQALAGDRRSVLSLCRLHCRTLRLSLLASIQDAPMSPTQCFDDEADLIFQLAWDAMSTDVDSSSSGPTDTTLASRHRRCFSLDVGVVAPVFLLALKTTKPSVAARALELLHAAQGRREGFYDAVMMAKMIAGLSKTQERLLTIDSYGEKMNGALESRIPTIALEFIAEDILMKGEREQRAGHGLLRSMDRLLEADG